MRKHLSKIAKIAARTFVLVLLTAGIGFLSRCFFLFNYNMLEDDILSPRALRIIFLAFFVLIINSLAIAIYRKSKTVQKDFFERCVKRDFLSRAKYTVCSPDFCVETICITVLSVLLPSSFLFGFEATNWNDRLLILLMIVPVFVILNFIGRMDCQKYWRKGSQDSTDKHKAKKIIKDIVLVCLIYSACAMCLSWIFPILYMLWYLGSGRLLIWIVLALIGIVLLTLLFFVIRGISKRKAFLKKLKSYCKDNALKISEIKKPYLSMFLAQNGSDFTVEKNGQKFECKLIAGFFPNSLIIFYGDGRGMHQNTVRLFRIELFHFMTGFTFGFKSDGKKILIIVPIPRRFYVSANNTSPRQADTGEKLGEYTIYNATGFLRALERDCL